MAESVQVCPPPFTRNPSHRYLPNAVTLAWLIRLRFDGDWTAWKVKQAAKSDRDAINWLRRHKLVRHGWPFDQPQGSENPDIFYLSPTGEAYVNTLLGTSVEDQLDHFGEM